MSDAARGRPSSIWTVAHDSSKNSRLAVRDGASDPRLPPKSDHVFAPRHRPFRSCASKKYTLRWMGSTLKGTILAPQCVIPLCSTFAGNPPCRVDRSIQKIRTGRLNDPHAVRTPPPRPTPCRTFSKASAAKRVGTRTRTPHKIVDTHCVFELRYSPAAGFRSWARGSSCAKTSCTCPGPSQVNTQRRQRGPAAALHVHGSPLSVDGSATTCQVNVEWGLP